MTLPEVLVLELPREWTLAHAVEIREDVLLEYLPEGANITDWREMVTVRTNLGAQDAPLSVGVGAYKRQLKDRLFDGKFEWITHFESRNELVYEWTMDCDLAMPDQFELGRIVRGEQGLHTAFFSGRYPHGAWDHREEWINRLMRASLSASRSPDELKPAGIDEEALAEVQGLVARLDHPIGEGDWKEHHSLYQEVIQLADRAGHPDVVPSCHIAFGSRILESTSEEAPKAALEALRHGLEHCSREGMPDVWGQAVFNLACAYLRIQTGDPQENGRRVVAACTRLLETLDRNARPQEWAATTHLLAAGHGLRGIDEEGQRLRQCVEALEDVLRIHTLDSAPHDFVHTKILLGDVYCTVGGPQHIERAMDLYSEALAIAFSNPAFDTADAMMVFTETRKTLIAIDQARGGGEAIVRDKSIQRRPGTIFYLRPFRGVGKHRLRNEFENPESFELQFHEEPEFLSIEAVLYRTLGSYMEFLALGGRYEHYGGSRCYIPGATLGDWRESAARLVAAASIVIVVPGDSDGIQWEIEHLCESHAIGKSLFVMSPPSPDTDVPALWEQARNQMMEFNLHLPPYREEGAIVLLGADGTAAEEWPFRTIWQGLLFEHVEAMLTE